MKTLAALPWKSYFVWDDSEEDAKPTKPNVRAFTPFQAAQEFAEDTGLGPFDEWELAVQGESESKPTLYTVAKQWTAEKSQNEWKP